MAIEVEVFFGLMEGDENLPLRLNGTLLEFFKAAYVFDELHKPDYLRLPKFYLELTPILRRCLVKDSSNHQVKVDGRSEDLYRADD